MVKRTSLFGATTLNMMTLMVFLSSFLNLFYWLRKELLIQINNLIDFSPFWFFPSFSGTLRAPQGTILLTFLKLYENEHISKNYETCQVELIKLIF